MPATQTHAAMTLAAYTDALASACTAAGVRCRAWHGTTAHRVYRGDDYVDVLEASDDTGMFSNIKGRDRGFGAALRTADRALGNVPIIAAAAAPTRQNTRHTDWRTGCPCGSLCETPRGTDCARCRLDY